MVCLQHVARRNTPEFNFKSTNIFTLDSSMPTALQATISAEGLKMKEKIEFVRLEYGAGRYGKVKKVLGQVNWVETMTVENAL